MSSHQTLLDTLTDRLHETTSLREGAKLRKLRDGYKTLVDNDSWLAGKINPIAPPTTHRRS